MQDVILLVSTSAIFIFGYFLMNKLDVFLENNWNRQETALTYGENSLRIGFSNPLMAGSLSDVLETYGKQHPDVSIHIFLLDILSITTSILDRCFSSWSNNIQLDSLFSSMLALSSSSLTLT